MTAITGTITMWRCTAAAAAWQGLTLAHFSAQRERFSWYRGLRVGVIQGVF